MERAGLAVRTDPPSTEAPPIAPKLQENFHPRTSQPEAKEYSRRKLLLGLANGVLSLILTLVILGSGLASALEMTLRRFVENDYLVLLGFALLFGVIEGLFLLPLKISSGYVLEHRYGLSNQTPAQWVKEGLKGMTVGAIIALPVLLFLYWSLRSYGNLWWLPVGVALFLLSVLLARLAPVLVFPLFFKFKALEENVLKERIIALCEKVGMRVSGVYVFNMSKNTKKANAAFTGIGTSRRILIGDTLIANCTDDEIELVVAHELGHFSHRHLRTMILLGALSTFGGLFGAAALYTATLSWFGFASMETIAALPLLAVWLSLFSLVTGPFSNVVSRAHERQADRFAVALTGKKEAFIAALRKLGRINLADPAPHPWVEFLFYSHPSIERRIRLLEGMQTA